jgi:hypothetical protein
MSHVVDVHRFALKALEVEVLRTSAFKIRRAVGPMDSAI